MKVLMLLLATAVAAFAQSDASKSEDTNPAMKVRVTGDRVSLRAAPELDGYLLSRAMRGEELVFHEKTNGWVGVQAPESLDLWISSEYVQNGVVQPEKLNVRAGPSLNYATVGVLNKGDSVAMRGEFNNWLKIVPPASCSIWISEEFVEFIQPPAPEPVVEVAPEPEATPEPEAVEEPEASEMASESEEEERPDSVMLVLDKNRTQGDYVEIPGVLRRAHPGLYQLVLIDGGFEEPICLVRGKVEQMERYLNRGMLIKGKRYWAKDIDLPVIQPERIHLDPILSE